MTSLRGKLFKEVRLRVMKIRRMLLFMARRVGDENDMSKVKCFAYHKTNHYASQCPNKKKSKEEIHVATSTSTKIDDFAEKVKKEFCCVLSFRQ
jgi:hypothetical protein